MILHRSERVFYYLEMSIQEDEPGVVAFVLLLLEKQPSGVI